MMSLRDLESMTWISREEGSASRAAIEAAWADLGVTPSHRLDLPAWEAVKLAVSRGHGVAACSRFAVERELRIGALALIRLRGWSVRRTISIIRLREAALTPSAQDFLALLKARWSGTSTKRARRSSRRPYRRATSSKSGRTARRAQANG
jgi:LysR family transcriptional regulator, transcriptional activator of the cysJI operon